MNLSMVHYKPRTRLRNAPTAKPQQQHLSHAAQYAHARENLFDSRSAAYRSSRPVVVDETAAPSADEIIAPGAENPDPERFVEHPPLAELPEIYCEECEQERAIVSCRACDEVFCQRCHGIVHLRTTTGLPHIHIEEQMVHWVDWSDRGAPRPVVEVHISPWDIPESELPAERLVNHDFQRAAADEDARLLAHGPDGEEEGKEDPGDDDDDEEKGDAAHSQAAQAREGERGEEKREEQGVEVAASSAEVKEAAEEEEAKAAKGGPPAPALATLSAPAPTPVQRGSPKRTLLPFGEGEVVVFGVDNLVEDTTREVREFIRKLQAPKAYRYGHYRTGFRGIEFYGRVMGVPHPRDGTMGQPRRAGDRPSEVASSFPAHVAMDDFFRVRMIGVVVADIYDDNGHVYKKPPIEFHGVDFVGGSTRAVGTYEIGKGREIDRRIEEARKSREPQKIELQDTSSVNKYPSRVGGRTLNPLQKGIVTTRIESNPADIDELPQFVVLLPESAIMRPREKREQLRCWRADACHAVLAGIDGRLAHREYGVVMVKWKSFTMDRRFEAFTAAAVKVQAQVRRHACRYVLHELYQQLLAADWARRRRIHNRMNYSKPYVEISAKVKKAAYSVDNKVFFATKKELDQWAQIWMYYVRRMGALIVRGVRQRTVDAFTIWKADWLESKTGDDDDADEDESAPGTAPDTVSTVPSTRGTRTTTDGVEEFFVPWHPAEDIELPTLPQPYAKRGPDGGLDIENKIKYNTFRAHTVGPCDTNSWLVPGVVAFGAYPEGIASKKAKRLSSYPDSVSQLLLAGIDVYVSLMPDHEEREFERKNKLRTLPDLLKRQVKSTRKQLKAACVHADMSMSVLETELQALPICPKYDLRWEEMMVPRREVMARLRLARQQADRAHNSLRAVPGDVSVLRFPVENDCEFDSDEMLLEAAECIESYIREGRRVFFFSRLGHGRVGVLAAALLGRLYGLPARVCLARTQLHHDARPGVDRFSCPQTMPQVAQVERVIGLTEGYYVDVYEAREDETGRTMPLSKAISTRRGIGMPVYDIRELRQRRRIFEYVDGDAGVEPEGRLEGRVFREDHSIAGVPSPTLRVLRPYHPRTEVATAGRILTKLPPVEMKTREGDIPPSRASTILSTRGTNMSSLGDSSMPPTRGSGRPHSRGSGVPSTAGSGAAGRLEAL